jgi:hypothetical protein
MAPQEQPLLETRPTEKGYKAVDTTILRDFSRKVARRSTRYLVVDERFARILADELGIKITTARTAFIGEPQRRASEISGWALDNSSDPAERARMILAWAKKHRAVAFRDMSDAELLRTVRSKAL